ncbi:MutT/nudix family protein [Listeria seeligeri FSL N1-067]|uniref:MutT/nudix family protein n=1 Tax=Listeria seeligeri FSL N1-067 TaxID=702453 RepID=E3ZU31_LISSE|nr:MutT/nudix family protein [Listeria seeligeri FSL N1-067]
MFKLDSLTHILGIYFGFNKPYVIKSPSLSNKRFAYFMNG